jgi:very-short-patch-repair endonuclease
MSKNKANPATQLDGRENPGNGMISYGYHLPYNPDLVARAKELRKSMTDPEKKLWEGYLRNHRFRFFRQRPIDHFIVDFYCAGAKLIIELDGEPHFSSEGKGRDEERTGILEGYGLRMQRFTNAEVMRKFEWVCERIEILLR